MKSLTGRRFALLLAAWATTWPTVAAAQPTPVLPSPLSLGDVIRLASERRDEIQAARARTRAGEARPTIVSALQDPMISPSLDHLPFMLGGADVSITIEQQIPLSGIPRHRRASALADVDRLRFGSKDLSFPPFLLSSSRSRAYVGRARLHLRAPQETNDDQMNDRMQECIDRCQGCQEACLEAISHCLKNSGRHAEAEHIQTLIACAEICDTSA